MKFQRREFEVLYNDLQERIKNFPDEEYKLVEVDMNSKTFSVTNPLTDETKNEWYFQSLLIKKISKKYVGELGSPTFCSYIHGVE